MSERIELLSVEYRSDKEIGEIEVAINRDFIKRYFRLFGRYGVDQIILRLSCLIYEVEKEAREYAESQEKLT